MATPTEAMMREMFAYGTGVEMMTGNMLAHIPLSEFWYMPEPGERNPWSDRVYFPWEPYDDGGGAALAAYQFGGCVCAPGTARERKGTL